MNPFFWNAYTRANPDYEQTLRNLFKKIPPSPNTITVPPRDSSHHTGKPGKYTSNDATDDETEKPARKASKFLEVFGRRKEKAPEQSDESIEKPATSSSSNAEALARQRILQQQQDLMGKFTSNLKITEQKDANTPLLVKTVLGHPSLPNSGIFFFVGSFYFK